ncbi:MAG: RlmE family RNA methyltransferase [Alphaproteobacteria bacterium]
MKKPPKKVVAKKDPSKQSRFFGANASAKGVASNASKGEQDRDVTAGRDKTVRVKSARGRKYSSTRWLQRQLNDPYVAEAQRQGYRSRAAFKLLEMHQSHKIFKSGQKVIDLGAAPGGWCQVAEAIVGERGKVVGIDIQEVEPIANVPMVLGDIRDPNAQAEVLDHLGGKADVVMSDMAASSTGHRQTDHMRVMALVETSLDFSDDTMVEGGTFLAKVLTGGTDTDLLKRLNSSFKTVKHVKPNASRADSREMYVVALGFKGPSA